MHRRIAGRGDTNVNYRLHSSLNTKHTHLVPNVGIHVPALSTRRSSDEWALREGRGTGHVMRRSVSWLHVRLFGVLRRGSLN